ncbi:MAG: DUF4870 domain-containing protein [Verrucomicrobia bacterium]|nr:DUF4870 domain-containing protein [Verrucomicrobiota bacterium]
MNGMQPAENTDRTWDIICHLTALAGFIGIPLGAILGPLVVWLVKKQELPSVDAHGIEALNFQISMAIYTVLAALGVFVLIGMFLLPLVLLTNLVLIIVASVKASKGELYRYPLTIRFIK